MPIGGPECSPAVLIQPAFHPCFGLPKISPPQPQVHWQATDLAAAATPAEEEDAEEEEDDVFIPAHIVNSSAQVSPFYPLCANPCPINSLVD